MNHHQRPSPETWIRAVVPSIVDWRTYRGATANLLVFLVAALSGEWLVHQLEYLIEYGRAFGTVMNTTPHRFYMGPLGASLAAAGLVLLALAAWALTNLRREHGSLLARLPNRLKRRIDLQTPALDVRRVLATAMALALVQITLYLVQENVESALESSGLPGLGVLFGSQHLTVVPLHVLIALSIAVLLRVTAGALHHSRRTVQTARILVRLLPEHKPAPRLWPGECRIPNLRIIAGVLGLRSPPLSV